MNQSRNTSGKGPNISYLKFYTREDWKYSWKVENTLANIFPQNANVTDRKVWKEVFAISQSKE